jgi:hypothetical protein
MRHRLAVEADHGDLVRRQTGIAQELLHREDVGAGDQLRGGDDLRVLPRFFEGERKRRGGGELRARGIRIGLPAERDRANLALPVRLDQRRIDPVERRAGHETNRQHHFIPDLHRPRGTKANS